METLKKLNQARNLIREMGVKKKGFNDYSKYSYFTPEQINDMVNKASSELGLFNKFDLSRGEFGLTATLTIYDLDSDDSETFKMATDIPSIKATNIAQQLGGAVTYSERYLKMIAYNIVENAMDFDSHDNRDMDSKLTKDQKTELGFLIENSNYSQDQKDKLYDRLSDMRQTDYDTAKARLLTSERSASDSGQLATQKQINKVLDEKL
jgi:hypothetical protein